MARKPKKSGGNGVIAGVVLFLIVGGILSAMPWLLLIIIPIVILYVIGSKKNETAERKFAPDGSSRLSVEVNNDLRIMTESLDLLNTSTNLKTVISRYDTLVSALQRLAAYEGNPAVSFPREQPSVALSRISAEKPEIFNRAIRRTYDDVLRKCATLKTEKGRKNRQLRFFDELNELLPSFPAATQDFAMQFINEHINDPVPRGDGS